MTYRFHAIVLLIALLWQSVFMLTLRFIASLMLDLEHITIHGNSTKHHHNNQPVHVGISDQSSNHLHANDGSIGSELLEMEALTLAIVESPLLRDTSVKLLGPTTYLETRLRPPKLLP
jgi:hypothetical protein